MYNLSMSKKKTDFVIVLVVLLIFGLLVFGGPGLFSSLF